MPSRRRLLAGVGCTVAAGCLRGDGSSGSDDATGTETENADDSDSDESENEVTEPTRTVLRKETKRGRADPLTAHRTEWDRWVKYLEEEDAVRYVASKGPSDAVDPDDYDQEPPDRELTFTTTPYDRWKHIRADDIAGEAAAEHVAKQLGRDDVGRAIDVSSHPQERDTVVLVEETGENERESDSEPSDTDPAELANVTPKSVDVTYELDGKTFETTRVIYARYRKLRLE